MENKYILDMIGINSLFNMEGNMMVMKSSYLRYYFVKVKRICYKFD